MLTIVVPNGLCAQPKVVSATPTIYSCSLLGVYSSSCLEIRKPLQNSTTKSFHPIVMCLLLPSTLARATSTACATNCPKGWRSFSGATYYCTSLFFKCNQPVFLRAPLPGSRATKKYKVVLLPPHQHCPDPVSPGDPLPCNKISESGKRTARARDQSGRDPPPPGQLDSRGARDGPRGAPPGVSRGSVGLRRGQEPQPQGSFRDIHDHHACHAASDA